MAARIDILLDADGDLPIEDNNLTLGFSDEQHMKDCIVSNVGWWKQYPANGVGISLYQKSRYNRAYVENKVKQQLTNDRYTVKKLNVTSLMEGLGISVNATR